MPPFLSFAAYQMKSCVSMSIINDWVVEDTEIFIIALERTDDLDSSITLNPAVGRIEITDNDSAEC